MGRDIGLALAVKAVALTLLYVAFFGPGHGIPVAPADAAKHLLSPVVQGQGMER
ncbi:MAG: cytochrome oxidase putative small subunit CydP [Alphaproteobacteria bacterium]